MPATPPGDQSRYNTRGFDFAHYGVRVPALIISPLIEPGTVDSKVHDHVSVLKTVEKRLGLPPLSLRDKVGSTSEAFDDLFTRFEPRADSPDLPAPYFDPPHRSEAMSLLSQNIALDVNTRNFVHLAGRIEKSMIDEKAQDYIAQVAAIDVRLAVLDKSDQKEAKKYIQEIQKKAKIRKEGGAK
jgi:phospholipase C